MEPAQRRGLRCLFLKRPVWDFPIRGESIPPGNLADHGILLLSPACFHIMLTCMGKVIVKLPATANLPSTVELHGFLRRFYCIDCQDPTRPLPCWPALKITEPAFSDRLVSKLREFYRDSLRQIQDQHSGPRAATLKTAINRYVGSPTSDELFLIAGSHVTTQHRMRICLRMAGITHGDIKTALGVSKFSDWLIDPEDKNYNPLPKICEFMDLDLAWVRLGPKAYSMSLGDRKEPWWLTPWRVACYEAQRTFEIAARTVPHIPPKQLKRKKASPILRACLLHRQPEQPGYDFAAFWAAWKAQPDALPLYPPPGLDWLEVVGPKKKRMPKPGLQAPSFLPWMFKCCAGFNTGDRSFLARFTPETWATHQWMMTYFALHGDLQTLKPPLPLGSSPTGADMLALHSTMMTPSGSAATAPDGRKATFSP